MFRRSARVLNMSKYASAKCINKRGFFTIIRQYKRGVKMGFGKYLGTMEPGIRLNLPFYHKFVHVDMREHIANIKKQSLISRDNVTFYVDASVQYKIVDPEKAVFNVDDLHNNVNERCQMQMRNILSSLEINEILHNREDISQRFMDNLESIQEDWGVKITTVQIRDISFEESMRRAMAVKAEADRNAEAKIINARADVLTAKEYQEAAKIYGENPVTLRLREYQLWSSVSKNPNNTIYVVPSNIVDGLSQLTKSRSPEHQR